MGASQRTKGHSFERRVAQWLREDLKLGDFWRNTVETQQGNSGDVIDRGSRWPLTHQTKHGISPSPWNAMNEAEEAAKPHELPVAIVRRNGGETIVVMRPEGYARLLLAVRDWSDHECDYSGPPVMPAISLSVGEVPKL